MHIREFIFKNTIRNIGHQTLIQNKLNGGIGLHDINTKIKAFRLKHLDRVRIEPHYHPLAQYYIGHKINTILKTNNLTPHYGGTDIGNFYKDVLNIFKTDKNIMGETTKKIYDILVKRQLTPLHNRIKWTRVFNTVDISDTFRNLHIKCNTQKEIEVGYRLIYNTTAITRNPKTNTNIRTTCQLCKQNIQETERHIYLECTTTDKVRQTLGTMLKATQAYTLNIAITLNNIIKSKNRTDDENKLTATAIYRYIIWTTRNKTKYDGKSFTDFDIDAIFKTILRRRLGDTAIT